MSHRVQDFPGSTRTPTTPLCFRVSRVTHAEPRSDFRTHHRSKIARKTCALLIAFPAPRFRRPSGVGSPPNAPEAGRQSRTRLGAVLGYWCMTQRHAGARETPRARAGAFCCRGLRHCNMGAESCTGAPIRLRFWRGVDRALMFKTDMSRSRFKTKTCRKSDNLQPPTHQ